MKIDKVIAKAEELLQKKPYDEGHDLIHHLEVWKNAQDIASHTDLEVNLDALHVACMWHDVVVTETKSANSTSKFLATFLQEEGFANDFVNKVVLAVKLHEYRQKPITAEGKILYDADKLEFIGLDRWQRIFQALKTKKMSKLKFFLYKQAGKRYIKHLRGKYHFDHTRKLHDERIASILKSKEAQQMAKEVGENLESILVG